MNKKGFAPIILLIIIGILVVAGGAYYFSKKSATAIPVPEVAKNPVPNSGPDNSVAGGGASIGPNDSRLPLKLEDIQAVSNAQILSLDLSNYQKEKGFYPKTLDAFFADVSYVNRGIILGKNQISDFTKNMSYIISSNPQGFVLYVNLKLTKNEDGNINGQPLDRVSGTVLGVDCSSEKTVCFKSGGV